MAISNRNRREQAPVLRITTRRYLTANLRIWSVHQTGATSSAGTGVTVQNWASVAEATSITIFLMALAALWFGCSNSAREVVGEWAIYHRERMVNLKIPSYVGSKFTVLGGLCLLQCAVLLGIVYWGAGLTGPWLAMFAVLLLTSLVGTGIGLTVSALARTSEVAIALLPLILLPIVILAGILQPLHEMNAAMEVLSQAMPSRWAFEGVLLLEVEDRPTWTLPPDAESAKPHAASGTATPVTQQAATQQDMAEKFFPAEAERMGTRASVVALAAMLILLIASMHVILRARDVH
jgi:ABC-type polysaccharide/polyol phosphate export permease